MRRIVSADGAARGVHGRRVLRAGAGCGIVGSILLLVANAAHPRPSRSEVGEHEAFLRLAAESDRWLAVHLAILLGSILFLGGLVALALALRDDRGAAYARVALAAALVGGAVSIVQHSIDTAFGEVADDWAAAPVGEKETIARIAAALEDVDFTLLSVNIVVLFGITFALFGAAVLQSVRYPSRLGWVAVAGGFGSALVGVSHLFTGPSTVTLFVFPALAALLSLWLLALSVLVWRRAANAVVAEAPSGAA